MTGRKKKDKNNATVDVVITITIIIALIALVFWVFKDSNLNPALPDKVFDPPIDNNIGYNCYQKAKYIDCYITPSENVGVGFVCVGCSDTLLFYRCYNELDICILMDEYVKAG